MSKKYLQSKIKNGLDFEKISFYQINLEELFLKILLL